MASRQTTISNQYQKNFDPHAYRNFKVQHLEANREKYDFWLTSLYEFFTTEEFSGNRLLDLASGPSVYNIVTASSYFSDIILSDFLDSNREELWKWLRRDPDRLDWTPYFKRVAVAEKRQDIDGACKEMEDRIRSAVKDVVHCDVLSQDIIPKETRSQLFDLVLSSLTLESSTADWETYSHSLGCINSLLKKGGKLIMMCFLKCNGYTFSGHRFHCLPLNKGDVQNALEVNGYVDIKWKILEQSEDFDIPYFLSATKA